MSSVANYVNFAGLCRIHMSACFVWARSVECIEVGISGDVVTTFRGRPSSRARRYMACFLLCKSLITQSIILLSV
jgi:hypothetical protein